MKDQDLTRLRNYFYEGREAEGVGECVSLGHRVLPDSK